MPDFIFLGVNRPDLVSLLAAEHVAGMVNAQVACQPAMMVAYRSFEHVSLILDSGAFQGASNVTAYKRVVEQVGDRFAWIANLDVIGDPVQSHANYILLTNNLPRPLREKLLWIYQGGSLSTLVAIAQERKFVGIGGIVPLLKDEGIHATLRRLRKIGEVLLKTQAHVHIFGLGSFSLLRELCQEPWLKSVDSSKWLIGYRAQELLLASGQHASATRLGLRLTRRECAASNIRVMQEWLNPPVAYQRTFPFFDDSALI